MSIDWTRIHHFKMHEFKNPDCLRWEMLEKLDQLRDKCGFEFIITSSFRIALHNAYVGGAQNSSHCLQWDGLYSGVDFTVNGGLISPRQLDTIIKYSYEIGFRRRGIYKDRRHVHLDIEERLDQDVLWID